VVYKQPLFKDDYGGHSQSYSNNVALFGGGCIHSNIAPRDPHGRERCHFSSPCADKDPSTSFTQNHCVGASSGIRCINCEPGIDCAVIQGNTYYSATANATNNGSAVCPTGNNSLEAGSIMVEIPSDEAVLQLCRATLGMPAAARALGSPPLHPSKVMGMGRSMQKSLDDETSAVRPLKTDDGAVVHIHVTPRKLSVVI
jgi:hypothetical protein